MGDPARQTMAHVGRWILHPDIRHFPGMPITTKDVYSDLWTLAAGQPGTITTSTAAVAASVGIFDRAARRAFRQLHERFGGIRIIEWPAKGALTIWVEDPGEARRAHVLRYGEQAPELFPEAPQQAPQVRPIRGRGPAAIGEVMGQAFHQFAQGVRQYEAIDKIPGDRNYKMHVKIVEAALRKLGDSDLHRAVMEEIVRVCLMEGGLGEYELWFCIERTLRNTGPLGPACHVPARNYLIGMIAQRCEKREPPIAFKYVKKR